MKKYLLLTILLTAFATSQVVTIIDKGIERKIYIPDGQNIKARVIDNKSQKGIIVAFKNTTVDIIELEQEYNIKLIKNLTAGYKIFANNSNLSDIDLITKLTKEKKEIIKTIRPNWGFGMMPN